MKSLQEYIYESDESIEYISEGLLSKYVNYFKRIYNFMKSLTKNNDKKTIDVDEDKIGCPKKPFKFDDFSKDETFKKVIDDDKIGFTVINQMLQMPKKYLVDKDKSIKPNCWPFSYVDKKNMYFVGISMTDPKTTYVDEYLHLIAIETSLIVSESLPVLKKMLNITVKNSEKKNIKYKGLSAKPSHPKMKSILLRLGFIESDDNSEIMTYKIKNENIK